jgi:hypothetical protein
MYIWRIQVENKNSNSEEILITVDRFNEYVKVKEKVIIDV